MKVHIKYKITMLLGIFIGMFTPAIAQNKVFIPDYNFRFFLNSRYPTFMDTSGDSLIIDSAATLIDTLEVSLLGASNLIGVQYFTNISALFCVENYLQTLPDLSTIENLTILNCEDNTISILPDFSANKALTTLICSVNILTSLPDLSANTELTVLKCGTNRLNYPPNLSSNMKLKILDFSNNELTTFPDLPNTSIMEIINCNNNQLSSLPDISANIALSEFLCNDNKLDFSDAKELRELDKLSSILSFAYSPQKPFGDGGSITLNEGETLTLSIAKQDSALYYQWFKNDVAIDGATDTLLEVQNVTINDGGSYTCKSYGTALGSPPMIHGPGISEFVSEPFHVTIMGGIGITDREYPGIIIYPNPNRGIFQIIFNSTPPEFNIIRIYSNMGQLLYTKKLEQDKEMHTYQFDLNEFSAGIYYLQLLSVGKVLIKQILIE